MEEKNFVMTTQLPKHPVANGKQVGETPVKVILQAYHDPKDGEQASKMVVSRTATNDNVSTAEIDARTRTLELAEKLSEHDGIRVTSEDAFVYEMLDGKPSYFIQVGAAFVKNEKLSNGQPVYRQAVQTFGVGASIEAAEDQGINKALALLGIKERV